MKFKFRKYFLSFLLISISFLNLATAQNKYNFEQFFDDSKELIKAPSNWNKNDLLTFGTVIGSAFLIMNIDENVRKVALSDRRYYYSLPVEAGRIWGEPYFTGIITGGLVLQSLVSGVKKNRETAFEIAQSFFYTASITAALKLSFGRARPLTGKDAFSFKPFQKIRNEFRSFPSGHTSTAFSLSTVLASRSKETWQKIMLYFPAFVTAISRIYQNHHWLSDVFIGGCIGYFIGKFVTDLHNESYELELIEPVQQFHFSLYF